MGGGQKNVLGKQIGGAKKVWDGLVGGQKSIGVRNFNHSLKVLNYIYFIYFYTELIYMMSKHGGGAKKVFAVQRGGAEKVFTAHRGGSKKFRRTILKNFPPPPPIVNEHSLIVEGNLLIYLIYFQKESVDSYALLETAWAVLCYSQILNCHLY